MNPLKMLKADLLDYVTFGGMNKKHPKIYGSTIMVIFFVSIVLVFSEPKTPEFMLNIADETEFFMVGLFFPVVLKLMAAMSMYTLLLAIAGFFLYLVAGKSKRKFGLTAFVCLQSLLVVPSVLIVNSPNASRAINDFCTWFFI